MTKQDWDAKLASAPPPTLPVYDRTATAKSKARRCLRPLRHLPPGTCFLVVVFLAAAVTWASQAVPAQHKTEDIIHKISPSNRKFINQYDVLVAVVWAVAPLLLAAAIAVGCLRNASKERMKGTEGDFPYGKRWYKRSRCFALVVTALMYLFIIVMCGVLAYTCIWWTASFAAEQATGRITSLFQKVLGASNQTLADIDQAWEKFSTSSGVDTITQAFDDALNAFGEATGVVSNATTSAINDVVSTLTDSNGNKPAPAAPAPAPGDSPIVLPCNPYTCLDLSEYAVLDSTLCICEPQIIATLHGWASDTKSLLYGAVAGNVIMMLVGVILCMRLASYYALLYRDQKQALAGAGLYTSSAYSKDAAAVSTPKAEKESPGGGSSSVKGGEPDLEMTKRFLAAMAAEEGQAGSQPQDSSPVGPKLQRKTSLGGSNKQSPRTPRRGTGNPMGSEAV